MRTIFALCAVILAAGCLADEASRACRDVIAKEAPGIERRIWEQCSSYYEDVALPKIREEIDNATRDLLDEIERRVNEEIKRYGCVRADGSGAWDCRGTALCK